MCMCILPDGSNAVQYSANFFPIPPFFFCSCSSVCRGHIFICVTHQSGAPSFDCSCGSESYSEKQCLPFTCGATVQSPDRSQLCFGQNQTQSVCANTHTHMEECFNETRIYMTRFIIPLATIFVSFCAREQSHTSSMNVNNILTKDINWSLSPGECFNYIHAYFFLYLRE